MKPPAGSPKVITIEHHILEQQANFPDATGTLTNLLYDIALAGKLVASLMRRAGLFDILGAAGRRNVQGEEVQKLDIFANNAILEIIRNTGRVVVAGSEEMEEAISLSGGKYVLLFDPLDGSSNIDFNISVGTIFAIYKRLSRSGPGTVKDCLQPGHDLVAAGYVLYGSSTMLVYSTGDGVNGFTLDPAIGEFLLSHQKIRMASPQYFSANLGYQARWSEGVRRYASWLAEETGSGQNLSLRYIGSMVADVHRTLLRGGVFFYPADVKSPRGKLRLLYEAAPMAYLVEQAGGAGTDGAKRILDLVPDSLHQRTPVFLGDRKLVLKAAEFIKNYD